MEPLNSKDPKTIGGFTLVGRLGKGGMGVVYLASRKSGSVALKVIRDSLIDDESEATRFSREVATLEQISSANVARIVEAGVDDGRAWFAAEFVNGPNLSELVNDKGPLDEDQWWELARGLLNGLADVHKTGVIHRDIKPANVIIAETGPKLIDFGIAHVSDATSVTATGLVAGSPAWFSPEQIEGLELTSATDVFSAGSVLTFAATGSSPWGGETTMTKASVFKILHSEPDLGGLSPEQQALASLMLEKEPSGRPTAASLLDNLDAIWAGEEPKLLALTRGGEQPNRKSSHPRVDYKSGDATTTAKRAVLNQTERASQQTDATAIAGGGSSAAVGWFAPVLAIPGFIVGLVLALVNIFKKQPSRGLILAYAGFQGLFVGGISSIFNGMWDGIVTQAVFGTLAVVGVTLFLFLSGRVRTSPKATKIFLVAMVGYLAFSLVNFGLIMFGATDEMFGLRSYEILGVPLGAILGVLIVLLAAYSLVMDFESIKAGVEQGAPRVFGWQAAFGIVVTVVWLYVEILRILAILRGE